MDEYITRAEHEEFVRRMEAEDHRSSKRLDVVEDQCESDQGHCNVGRKTCY